MLPQGAVHLPCKSHVENNWRGLYLNLIDKGVAKIAKKLGFDYAEAVVSSFIVGSLTTLTQTQTGFEFKKRRAFPIIEGVVVAVENEEILLEVTISQFHLLSFLDDQTKCYRLFGRLKKMQMRKQGLRKKTAC